MNLSLLLLLPLAGLSGTERLEWGDFDGDGLRDLLVLRPGASLRLMHNRGDGAFDDVTARAGLDGIEAPELALWYDADADEDLDLLVVSGGAVTLLSNEGAGFVDTTAAAGLAELTGVVSLECMDYDADGRADLQVETAEGPRLLHGRGRGGFALVALDRGARGGPSKAGSGHAAAPTPTQPPILNVPPGPSAIQTATCQVAISDFYLGGCLSASAVPTLGMLFAMSFELNVDAATGYVGMGTTAPVTHAHVVDSSIGLAGSALFSEDVAIESPNAFLGLFSDEGGGWGSGIALKEINNGTFLDNWTIARKTTNGGSDLAVTYGGLVDGPANPTLFTIQDDGNVGIDVAAGAADTRLHVEGGTDVTPTGGGFLQLGDSSGWNIGIDDNEIMARDNGVETDLHINAQGGHLLVSANSPDGNLGIGTTAPAGRLHVVDAAGGDGSVRLPTDSISRQETLDEPGLAHGRGSLSLSQSEKVVVSHGITVPTSGYVIAIATVKESAALGAYGFLHMEQNGVDVTPNYSSGTYLQAQSRHSSFHTLVPVTAGFHTFRILGNLQPQSTSLFVEAEITLLFVASAYGIVQ